VRSYLTEDFIRCFRALPKRIQQTARRNYRLWKDNPGHASLQFKRITGKSSVFSIRVGIGWRAIGVLEGQDMIWFWIGSHADYEKLIKSKR
jgi:hypothetical protein